MGNTPPPFQILSVKKDIWGLFPFFVIKDSIVTKLVDFHDSILNKLLMTKFTNPNPLQQSTHFNYTASPPDLAHCAPLPSLFLEITLSFFHENS